MFCISNLLEIKKIADLQPEHPSNNNVYSEDGISPCIPAVAYKRGPLPCVVDGGEEDGLSVADYRNDEGLRIRKEFISPCLPARRTSETDPSTMPPLLVKQIGGNNKSNSGRQPYQQDRVYDDESLSPALSENKNDLIVKKTLNENQQKKLDELNVDESTSGTLTEAIGRGGSSSEYLKMLKKNKKITGHIRRLTPIECERLQGFPDNWTDGQSDTQRYKQCGNAITVNVAELIFSKLFNSEENLKNDKKKSTEIGQKGKKAK